MTEFIDDMAEAYRWADLVVCRAGASTVAELAVAGLPSILVPYPHHRDQQQLRNAQWLSGAGAAVVIEQADLTVELFRSELLRFSHDRHKLEEMSRRTRDIAIADADSLIARHCLEVADG